MRCKRLLSIIAAALTAAALSGAAHASAAIALPVAESAAPAAERILSAMQTGGFDATDELKRLYVDHYAGMNAAQYPVMLYTTDRDAEDIRQLEADPGIEVKEVRYSLNRLNQAAAALIDLGESGRIGGYSAPPYVDADGNRVVLILQNRDDGASPLSDEEIVRAVNADASMLYFNHTMAHAQDGAVHVEIPKTGGAPTGFAAALPALAAAGCAQLHRKRG